MSHSDYCSERLLTTSLNIDARSLQGDVNSLLLTKLKQKYEGVCNKDGFIKHNSLEIVNRSMGEITTINGTSYVVYQITYKAVVLSPVKGIKMKVYIESVSKMGFIAYIKFSDQDTIKDSPFVVIVPKEYFEEETYNKYKQGDDLKVIVEASRIKYMSKNIQIVAKPV